MLAESKQASDQAWLPDLVQKEYLVSNSATRGESNLPVVASPSSVIYSLSSILTWRYAEYKNVEVPKGHLAPSAIYTGLVPKWPIGTSHSCTIITSVQPSPKISVYKIVHYLVLVPGRSWGNPVPIKCKFVLITVSKFSERQIPRLEPFP